MAGISSSRSYDRRGPVPSCTCLSMQIRANHFFLNPGVTCFDAAAACDGIALASGHGILRRYVLRLLLLPAVVLCYRVLDNILRCFF